MAARPDELIDSERIKHDIDRTREQMSGTIDEIQERLHPARLLHDATATVREASVDSMKRVFGRAGETAGRKAGEAKAASAAAADFARSHPLPAALLFAGLALVAAKVLGGSRRSMAESEDWDDASHSTAASATSWMSRNSSPASWMSRNSLAVGAAVAAAGTVAGIRWANGAAQAPDTVRR